MVDQLNAFAGEVRAWPAEVGAKAGSADRLNVPGVAEPGKISPTP